jgi:mannose-6-phosphate isomerase-like protein (cupin superfamily)
VPLIDLDALPILVPRPGWRGRFFHSDHMTFADYAIDPNAAVHPHQHEEEEVWHVLEGELEVTRERHHAPAPPASTGCSRW